MHVRGRVIRVAGCLLWLGAVGVGFSVLYDYGLVSGQTAPAPASWPAGTGLEPGRDRATLVMLAHPRCPCTRASISELHRLQAAAPAPVLIYVAFVRLDPRWERTDLWRRAAAIPGARVLWDEHGRLARRFGARTSGHVQLYDRDRRLAFSGGITPARGHEGTSPGLRAILARLDSRSDVVAEAPVYGCPLDGEIPR